MPEIDRGVAVAYCRPTGPLESTPLPTEFAVSPTPADWTPEQVTSFYREYNAHMLHNLTVHEAMPGTRCSWRTRIATAAARRFAPSGGAARSSRDGPCTARS